MFRRIDPFDLYHFGLGAICVAAFLVGCAPPPNQAVDDSPPPVMEEEHKPKVDIDIGGGNGVDIDIDGRETDNPAN